MPVNDDIGKEFWKDGHWPILNCVTCRVGQLILSQKIQSEETAATNHGIQISVLEPGEMRYTFRARLQCSNPACAETVQVIGTAKNVISAGFEDEPEWTDAHCPTCFVPAPRLIDTPKDMPKAFQTLVDRASTLMWVDPSACASMCRIIAERLLDHLTVPTEGTKKNGNPYRLTLHARIEQLAAQDADLSTLLLASKYIGNDGAHLADATRLDAIEALNFVEGALRHVFDRSKNDLLKRASAINAKQSSPSKP